MERGKVSYLSIKYDPQNLQWPSWRIRVWGYNQITIPSIVLCKTAKYFYKPKFWSQDITIWNVRFSYLTHTSRWKSTVFEQKLKIANLNISTLKIGSPKNLEVLLKTMERIFELNFILLSLFNIPPEKLVNTWYPCMVYNRWSCNKTFACGAEFQKILLCILSLDPISLYACKKRV